MAEIERQYEDPEYEWMVYVTSPSTGEPMGRFGPYTREEAAKNKVQTLGTNAKGEPIARLQKMKKQ